MGDFLSNLRKGDVVENFLSQYLEEVFRWKFIGGNINGKIVNKEEIENLLQCDYIFPVNKKHGHKLRFSDGEEFLMPDLLFRSERGLFFWTESKSSYTNLYRTIDLEKKKLFSYYGLQKKRKNPIWIIATFVSDKMYTMYSAKINDLMVMVENGIVNPFENKYYSNALCYTFDVESKPFQFLAEENR